MINLLQFQLFEEQKISLSDYLSVSAKPIGGIFFALLRMHFNIISLDYRSFNSRLMNDFVFNL